jgi:hypothetical protein
VLPSSSGRQDQPAAVATAPEPAQLIELADGESVCVIAGHAEAVQVLSDSRVLSADPQILREVDVTDRPGPAIRDVLPTLIAAAGSKRRCTALEPLRMSGR